MLGLRLGARQTETVAPDVRASLLRQPTSQSTLAVPIGTVFQGSARERRFDGDRLSMADKPALQNKRPPPSPLRGVIRRIHLQMLFRPLRHGTPASVRLRPGSARGPVGLGAWVAGPHYSAADADALDLVGCITVSVHHGHCEHHDDGCAESAHDRERHGLRYGISLNPPCSVMYGRKHCSPILVQRNRMNFSSRSLPRPSGASF